MTSTNSTGNSTAVVSTAAAASSSASITGTASYNISSDSTQLTYVGDAPWRSDTDPGYYQAYSNSSSAAVTFSFVGVGVSYFATKKADRGICMLTVDGVTPYTIDLYNDSGYDQGETLIWYSGTLVYGSHNVTLSQWAVDARLGFYPYLVSETWIEVVPTNVAAYVATQSTPSATATQAPTYTKSSNGAAIGGGVAGAVIACALAGFLFYLWRRDKARQRRSEGAPVMKVKKADGKMAIEDEPDSSSGGHDAYGRAYPPYAPYPPMGAYSDPYVAPYGYPHPYPSPPPTSGYPDSSAPPSWASPHYATHSVHSSADYPARSAPPASSPGFAPTRGSYYDSAYHSGGAGSEGGSGHHYPMHVQGTGAESRSYAVPELG